MLNKFNHKKDIKNTQPVKIQAISPGMIITFKYNSIHYGNKITDKNPLVLFLYFDSQNGLLDGLNLNYLSDYKFKKLFEGFKSRTRVTTRDEKSSNLLSEDFTFISIPPINKLQRPNSSSEIKKEMKMMYNKFVGPKFSNIYRSYSLSTVKTLTAVNLKDY